ncbi:MAG: acyl-CoA dehydrogenase family protein [Elusimicrobia bacterium]|nr:acyl-CoA dehydrogenase family protein [Elusimicrobiota bacterium]
MPGLDAVSRSQVLDSLRQYAKKKLPYEHLRKLDRDNEFPADVLKEMYDPDVLGIHLLLIPEEYGGLGGSTFDIYRVCEALAHIDLGIATSVFATFLGTDPIRVGGTEEQKKLWMGRIAEERLLVAYGATEPNAGSDLVALTTKAEHALEGGKVAGYKISGNKQWISNGGVANVYLILARAPGGPSWFIVEKGAQGFSLNPHEDKHGIRLSDTCGLNLKEVYVPVDRLVGTEEGQGLRQAQAVFGYTRVMVAAFGLGAGWEALETAIRYSQQRIQSGGPLSEKQGYMLKLIVPNAIRLEAARAYIEEIVQRLDGTEHGLQTEGAIAKFAATEAGNKAAEDSIQALGGYGYTKDFQVEKIKRDVKITCIYEGTNEIMEMTIFRGRWQEHLRSRGQYYVNAAAQAEQVHAACPCVGADAAALGLRALGRILQECRSQRLTQHQHVTMRIGELIAQAETAAAFARSAAQERFSETVKFDAEAWRAMSRVYARETALNICSQGLKLILGAGTAPAGLADELGLAAIVERQAGSIQDQDLVAKKLTQVFKSV